MKLTERLNEKPLTADIRKYLQDELVRRCDRNPKYSLRAFAKALKIYHGTLSALLSGKRPFSERTIKQVCQALSLSPNDFELFTRPATIPQVRSQSRDEVYKELTLDIFAATSEWYYDAILELTHTKYFRPDSRWVAKVLGLTVTEVNIAVERLERLELIKIEKSKWIDVSRNSTTIVHNDFTTAALQKYQKKILQLSLKAIEEESIENRDHTSMTVAVRPKDLPEVKEKIKKFRRSLTAFLEREGAKPEEVYQLAVSFFPLTKVREGNDL